MQRTNFGRDERQDRREAILAIGKAKVEDPVLKPVWSWRKTLTPSTGATLETEELSNSRALSNDFKSRILSGIGVYKPADMNYLEQCILIREASKGKIGCLFSDPNIVYGTNMPLITVYVGEAFGRNATRDCLYQLIGRAGRTGLANKARIVFEDNETLKRALLPNSDGASFEAMTMERFLFRLTPFTPQQAALIVQKCARGLIAKRLAQQMRADAQAAELQKRQQSLQSSATPTSQLQCVVEKDPNPSKQDPVDPRDPSNPRTELSRNQRRAIARKKLAEREKES